MLGVLVAILNFNDIAGQTCVTRKCVVSVVVPPSVAVSSRCIRTLSVVAVGGPIDDNVHPSMTVTHVADSHHTGTVTGS
jgi:hypothetical protein